MLSKMSLVLVLSTMVVIVVSSITDQCPSVCICKWKSGKRTVECMDRALITIPKEIDTETQVLDLSSNNLQILPQEAFRKLDLTNLQRLYLRSCSIGQIEKFAFKGLTNLIELDLSHNLLTAIPTDTFQSTPSLRDLILSHNPISKIDHDAFTHLSSLVKLDVSSCQLKTISPEAFNGIESLELLKLSDNMLSELPPRSLRKFERLHSLDLHSNPWLCDCRLRGVKEWLLINNMQFLIVPVCRYGPDHVLGQSFTELDPDDFACKPDMLPISRYVESSTGENATIVCRIGAVPSARVKWYWNGRLLINNSVFSSHQKIFIDEFGIFEKRSRLTLTNAQETDSGEFYCVAENRAGSAEANFTLYVSSRMVGMASLTTYHILGLSAALVTLILCILFLISLLVIRLKKCPSFDEPSKHPNQLEIVQNDNVPNGKIALTPVQTPVSPVTMNDIESSVMKPVYSPSSGSVNPDLINDTKRLDSCEFNSVENNYDPSTRQYYYGYPAMPNSSNPEFNVPPASSMNLKTLRVWQRGAIPVLPPMTAAFKRALHQNRGSPDEGYQEGNTTDV